MCHLQPAGISKLTVRLNLTNKGSKRTSADCNLFQLDLKTLARVRYSTGEDLVIRRGVTAACVRSISVGLATGACQTNTVVVKKSLDDDVSN